MPHSTFSPVERGKTWLDGVTAEGDENPRAGQEFEFTDNDEGNSTGRTCVLRFVKNNSGGAVFAKTLVLLDVTGKEIIGTSNNDYDLRVAVVDDQLASGGCPNGDFVMVHVRGPAMCLTQIAASGDNVIGAGDPVRGTTINAATTASTTVGRIQSAELTSSVTVATSENRAIIGRAMTARTTNNTAADVLVDLDIRF